MFSETKITALNDRVNLLLEALKRPNLVNNGSRTTLHYPKAQYKNYWKPATTEEMKEYKRSQLQQWQWHLQLRWGLQHKFF